MLNALMQLTQNSDAASSGASAADPVQQLFSAMDSDGDGEVSQSEMESTVEKFGGTQAQADSLFNSLSQTSASTGTASGISESQMQSALSSAQQAHGGGRHHHHHMQGGQADQVSNTLLQAMDSDDDGAVSQDELTSFVTANGGTAADAASDFAALDTSGSGALTSADFAKAFQSYQSQQNQQSGGAAMASLLDTLANASGTTLSA
jgi:Ca2+-binding EF-hand superfamily protein